MHGFVYVLVYGTNNAYSEYACLCECLFIWRCALYQSPAYLGHLSSNTPGTESPSLRVTFKLQFNTSLQRLFCRASDTQECIFLITGDTYHLFKCLLAIRTFFYSQPLPIVKLGHIFLLIYKNTAGILDTNSMFIICTENICPQILTCLLTSFYVIESS